jgi:NAD(P)-dependent dehydrogenase (short-subunit alcohol dehydrogenase family)
MGNRLKGKVALITGAASGIGSACALRFAEEGAAVAGIDISDAGDDRWQRACKVAPAHSFSVADVRDDERVAEVVAHACRELGRIDVLVNSAGTAGGGAVHELAPAEFERVIGINLTGTFIPCRHVLRAMLVQGSGSIVNIASIEGLQGAEGGSAYNASKGGVVLLTRSMAMDYARRGIRINAVCPGFIETPMFDSIWGMPGLEEMRDKIRDAHQLGRFGTAREVADAALFLASDESSFITGHALPVDGGFTAGHRFGIARLLGLE